MKFTHLHVHSHYSLLDGLAKIDQLINKAKKMGMESLALTDHGNLYGAIEFYTHSQEAGLKPILGCEFYLAPRTMADKDVKYDTDLSHLVILVKNETGYKNLLKLVTLAHLEGFYYKPRIDKETLKKYSEGLIGLSACLRGEIPKAILNKDEKKLQALLQEYQSIFSPGDFYLELQHHPESKEQKIVNEKLLSLTKEYNLKAVVTADTHYLNSEDAATHDILLAIQTGSKVDDEDRLMMKNLDLSLKDPKIILSDFQDYPELFENIKEIVDKCNLELTLGQLIFPEFKVAEGLTAFEYLEKLARERFPRYYREDDQVAKERLKYELSVIKQTGFADYFLIVQDFVNYARQNGIYTNTRGSAGGCLVSYVLGITDLDPIKYNLYFERFLNPERIAPPDIDVDVADNKRAELINYISQKYGQDHVAQIVTFGVMKARMSVRDVTRALGLSYSLGDQIAKLIPFGMDLDKALDEVYELRQLYQANPDARQVIDIARKLEGVVRHASTHAAGIVISKEPLVNYAPLQHSSRDQSEIISQYSMYDIEKIGLLKMDILGLANLTVIKNALRIIKKITAQEKEIDLDALGFEDKKVYELLTRGETIGVFQLESSGMRRYLKELKPTGFEDIIAMLALYRPGPMELIPQFIRRKHGEEKITYFHPDLRPILEKTYGICVTGDAVIQTANPGGIMRMDTVIKNSSSVNIQSLDFEKNKFIKKAIIRKYDNGVKDVYRIILRTGKEIKATAEHQFWTPFGWKPAKELKIGDFLATPKKLFVGNKDFDVNKIKVLAYLMADGSLTSGTSCYFVNKKQILLKDFKQSTESAFKNILVHFSHHIRNVRRAIPIKVDKTGSLYHQPNSVLRWLRELGLKTENGGFSSEHKFVPHFIFELKDNLIAAFLATFWDCDGGINKKFAYLTTISKRLAFDIQTLLLKLGINSYIYFTEKYVGRHEEIKKVYKLCVYDLVAFKEQIGYLMLTGKKKILKSLPKNICCREFVPRQIFLEKTLVYLKNHKISQRAFCRLAKINRSSFFKNSNRQRNRLGIEMARKIAVYLQDPALQKICDERNIIRWEDVVGIEYVGKERVYDIEVQGTHNYIVNNIISHNCVYQEQLMKIAHDLAGFSMAEADVLRKAVGKKIKSLFSSQKEKMLKGMIDNGIKPEVAQKIWNWFEPFASYGFNRSHSVSYARIAYQTAWLKTHYPNAFMAALLTSDFGDLDRISIEVAECERLGIKVLPPSVNESFVEFGVEKGTGHIRFGLSAIKNVGVGVAEAIVEERQRGGQYKNLRDFINRLSHQTLNKKSLESLIKSGALDCFGEREEILNKLPDLLKAIEKNHYNGNGCQIQKGLFGDDYQIINDGLDNFKEGNNNQQNYKVRLCWEKELLGLFLSQDPLVPFQSFINKKSLTIANLLSQSVGRRVKACGLLSHLQKITTKNGQPMIFARLADKSQKIELVIYPKVLAKYSLAIGEDKVVIVEGLLEKRNGDLQLVCEKIDALEELET